MRDLLQFLMDDIKELESLYYNLAPFNILILDADEKGYSLNQVKNGLNELIKKNIIEKISDNYYRSCY